MGALFLDFLDLIMAHATHIDAKKIAIYFTRFAFGPFL
jgi:hypothetical protein